MAGDERSELERAQRESMELMAQMQRDRERRAAEESADNVEELGIPSLGTAIMENVAPAETASKPRGCGPGLVAILTALIIAAAVFGISAFGSDKDRDEVGAQACAAHGVRSDELVLISFQQDGCEEEEEAEDTTTSSSTTTTEAPAGATFLPPAPEDLPRGAQLFEGSSGGNIGCIACDGAHRYIHITNSTIAVGEGQRGAQEIVWPEGGEVVDFGVNLGGPNRGRYGFALFANQTYRMGCGTDIGQTSCRTNQDPLRLEAGERVSIIIGEAGVLNPDGSAASVGDFTVSWWFVFQPD